MLSRTLPLRIVCEVEICDSESAAKVYHNLVHISLCRSLPTHRQRNVKEKDSKEVSKNATIFCIAAFYHDVINIQ